MLGSINVLFGIEVSPALLALDAGIGHGGESGWDVSMWCLMFVERVAPMMLAGLVLLAAGLLGAMWFRRSRRRLERMWRIIRRLRRTQQRQARDLRHVRRLRQVQTPCDALTEMLTREAFMEHLTRTTRRVQREPDFRAALLQLNLDRFKQINETFGHHVGDQLIRGVAERLRSSVRRISRSSSAGIDAVFGRVGGDEFVVLLRNLPAFADAHRLAEGVAADLAEPFRGERRAMRISSSMALVTSDLSFEDAPGTIRDADRALREAKRDGLGRTVVFDQAMKQALRDRIALEHELALALEEEALTLHYQPIVNLRTGRVSGFEALTRWFHPVRGPVSPGWFIPIAEDSGLILKLGSWVLREGCRQLAAWSARSDMPSPLTLSINVSPMQFAAGDFAAQVRQALAETGLHAGRLHIEITESTFMADTPTARRTLIELQAIGVSLNMDDFGTGYSSLSYLHRLPVDTIKIDRSFIAPMLEQPNLAAVVGAINDLAHNVGMRVIAEGVEEARQVEHLQAIGCDFGQGYVFGRPVGPEEAIRMVHGTRCPPREPRGTPRRASTLEYAGL